MTANNAKKRIKGDLGEMDAPEMLQRMLVSFAFATAGVFAFFLIIKLLQSMQ